MLGRPRIIGSEILKVKFLEDRSHRSQQLLSSKIKQQVLGNTLEHQLDVEVRGVPELCQLLDSLHTAREFLLQTGGDPEQSLPDFLVSHIPCFFLYITNTECSEQASAVLRRH